MWKCKICGKNTIGLSKTKYYEVDKNGNQTNVIAEDEEYVCLNCDTSAMGITTLADWIEESD